MGHDPATHPRREFALFLGGQAISDLGSAFTTVALPLLVFRLTGSPTDLGAASACSFAPWLLLGLIGGTLVDRVDRKRLLVLTDLLRAGVISVVPILSMAGALRLA